MSPSLMFRFLFKEYHIVNRTFFKVIASKVPLSSAMNKMIKDSSINKNLMIAGCMMKLSHFLFLIFRKQQIIIYKVFFTGSKPSFDIIFFIVTIIILTVIIIIFCIEFFSKIISFCLRATPGTLASYCYCYCVVE